MITTPEQMREAAAKCCDINNISPNFSAPAQSISTAMAIAAAIRAIPIAPQPVAVAVKPLKGVDQQVIAAAALLGDNGRKNPEWAFIDYEANSMSFGRWAKCGPNPAPYIRADIVLSALTIQPADPLSDPRVVALVDALQALGAMPEGYCFCSKDRIGDDSKIHEPECRDLRTALRVIGGEA